MCSVFMLQGAACVWVCVCVWTSEVRSVLPGARVGAARVSRTEQLSLGQGLGSRSEWMGGSWGRVLGLGWGVSEREPWYWVSVLGIQPRV